MDYGQRVSGYQGIVLPYADEPQPSYKSGAAPYFTIDCIGTTCPSKTPTRDSILALNANTSTIWTSDPEKLNGSGSHLFERSVHLKIAHLYQESCIRFYEPQAAQLHIYHTIHGLQKTGHEVTLLALQGRQVLCTEDLQVFKSDKLLPS